MTDQRRWISEADYYESRHFDREHVRRVRSRYVPFFRGCDLVVELGAGRGEFLEVVSPHVERVVAVDSDPGMVAHLRAAGWETAEADALEFLAGTELRPDGIFAAHLVEHLPVPTTFELFALSAKLMAPGSRFVVATPNPSSLAMLTQEFWSDPTHQRLYTIDLLEFLLDRAGFDIAESGENLHDRPGPPPGLAITDPPEPTPGLEVGIEPPMVVPHSDDPVVAALGVEMARIRAAVEALVNVFAVQDSRLLTLSHALSATVNAHERLIQHLYGANEIYAVGVKR